METCEIYQAFFYGSTSKRFTRHLLESTLKSSFYSSLYSSTLSDNLSMAALGYRVCVLDDSQKSLNMMSYSLQKLPNWRRYISGPWILHLHPWQLTEITKYDVMLSPEITKLEEIYHRSLDTVFASLVTHEDCCLQTLEFTKYYWKLPNFKMDTGLVSLTMAANYWNLLKTPQNKQTFSYYFILSHLVTWSTA